MPTPVHYPPNPRAVPEELTRPTRAYKVRAWLAVAVLLGFVAIYVSLTAWFGWTTIRLVRGGLAGGPNAAVGFLAAIPAAFFAVFLAKGLFFVKRGKLEGLVEVTAEEQPELFEFLRRIADDAKAPRPHRVFLSPHVNAGVFYDLSLANLVVPTRKNLEIGLGLVNTLSLCELKAVLGHEFGHFAQRTMAVGSWVYISQQIAGAIIAKRDALDRLLVWLSHIDIRIAWIGWIMRIIVWSIRSLLDSLFRIVVIAERALSREMEFNADRVSVSLAGSDALVHALHKLHAADDAFDRALRFAATERAQGRAVGDVFRVQSCFVAEMRRVLDDETHGQAPPLPATDRGRHRVFAAQLGQPPKMWATHPPNREREDSAKQCYVPGELDEESAWVVFAEPDALRAKVTAGLLEVLGGDGEQETEPELVPIDETLAQVRERFARASLDRRYHGLYLGRSPTREAAAVADLYAPPPAAGALRQALDALYPAALGADVERLRDLEEEHEALEALRDGFLTAPGGVIQHRGKPMRRKELPRAIDGVDAERRQVRERLREHERACRSAHRSTAAALGQGWAAYLESLVELLHYASHAEANLEDARGLLANVFSVVAADGRISSAELGRLVATSMDLYHVLEALDRDARSVVLPALVAERLEVESWGAAVPTAFELGIPTRENMGDWLGAIDGWVGAYAGPLGGLRSVTLDVLLETEARVASAWRDGADPGPAPTPATVPRGYATLVPGAERERQKKLDWWDRFQVADGVVPGVARFSVAVAIVGAVFALGGLVGTPTAIVYNGLNTAVEVRVGKEQRTLLAFERAEVTLPGRERVAIETRTASGELIEAFDAEIDTSFGKYVYNVAAASPLVEWTAVYGNATPGTERRLGAVRWTRTEAHYCFRDPPSSVSTKGGGATRLVLQGFGQDPDLALALLPDDAARAELARLHARWDDLEARGTLTWLTHASRIDAGVLEARLRGAPGHVALLRLEQDSAQGERRGEVCARHTARAEARPSDLDLRYLAIRCMDRPDERDRAYLREHRAAPKHPWLAMAAGHVAAERGEWSLALERSSYARSEIPLLAPVIAEQEARIRRVVAAERGAPPPSLHDLAALSPRLERHLSLESGTAGFAATYAELARGSLREAERACEASGASCAHLYRLVAASDGATATDRERALGLAADSIDVDTVWSGLALARLRGADDAPYVALVREHFPEGAETLLHFADPRAVGADPAADEAKLAKLKPFLRGQACVMGVLLLGDGAPARWRTHAKALLFAAERPFFR
jgi:Zn-dependent protease with chaperone function